MPAGLNHSRSRVLDFTFLLYNRKGETEQEPLTLSMIRIRLPYLG